MPKRKGSLSAVLASLPKDGGGSPRARPRIEEDDPRWDSRTMGNRKGRRPPWMGPETGRWVGPRKQGTPQGGLGLVDARRRRDRT